MAHELPTDLIDTSAGIGLIEGMAKWAYNVTFGWFWSMLLMGFCVVLYIAASRYSGDRAFGYAGVVGLFGAILLVTLNLMPWYVASIFIIVGAISIASMIMSGKGS